MMTLMRSVDGMSGAGADHAVLVGIDRHAQLSNVVCRLGWVSSLRGSMACGGAAGVKLCGQLDFDAAPKPVNVVLKLLEQASWVRVCADRRAQVVEVSPLVALPRLRGLERHSLACRMLA